MMESLLVNVDDPAGLHMASELLFRKYPEVRVFAFHGTLGAGKTTLIKTLCAVLGVGDVVTSPTFTLINEYRTPGGNPVYHFDFYRITKEEEAMDIGYEEYFYSGHYCFIEWPGRVTQLLPPEYVYVDIEVDESDHSRKITHSLIKPT